MDLGGELAALPRVRRASYERPVRAASTLHESHLASAASHISQSPNPPTLPGVGVPRAGRPGAPDGHSTSSSVRAWAIAAATAASGVRSAGPRRPA